jgi:hypothetical protein
MKARWDRADYADYQKAAKGYMEFMAPQFRVMRKRASIRLKDTHE